MHDHTGGPHRRDDAGPAIATVAGQVAAALHTMGVRRAFGISGGGVVPFFSALDRSPIDVVQTRHESGAAFMALESSLVDDRPAVVFTTTGPGLTNALTGLMAARIDGGRVILVGGLTPAGQRGRGAFQETSAHTMPFLSAGPVFHHVALLESAAMSRRALRALSAGLRRPGGFVGALLAPTDVQVAAVRQSTYPHRALAGPAGTLDAPACPPATVEACADRLNGAPFVLWVGWGARHAGPQLRAVAERGGAMVMSSPRAKGVFPEDHPQYLGVTGLGGHTSVERWFAAHRPDWVLVAGSRLGENTSGAWGDALRPAVGYIHIDVDPTVPGSAMAATMTAGVETAGTTTAGTAVVPVVADAASFLTDLLPHLRSRPPGAPHPPVDVPAVPRRPGTVRPEALMAALQKVVLDERDLLLLSEAGNSFAWASHAPRLRRAGRYRVSSGFGAMGHASAGVVGAALAAGRRCVALLGDGAILMNSELTTAVATRAPATWIVLNDGDNGMVAAGMAAIGFPGHDLTIPPVDFVGWARSQGVATRAVSDEDEVPDALRRVLDEPGPSLLDVRVQPGRVAPLGARLASTAQLSAAQLSTSQPPAAQLTATAVPGHVDGPAPISH